MVRPLLALAAFVVGLGVLTSGPVAAARDPSASGIGGSADHTISALGHSGIRWSLPPDKRRSSSSPLGGHLAVPSAASTAGCRLDRVATVCVATVVLRVSVAHHPASPRGPPRLPS